MQRERTLQTGKLGEGPVVYWLSRDQRAQDHDGLVFAQLKSIELNRPLVILFVLAPRFLGAAVRQYDFMLKGLQETAHALNQLGIAMEVQLGEPQQEVVRFIRNHDSALLIADFDPLKMKRIWLQEICENVECPVYEVDSHNIVPCWIASPKAEYGAYTIRPKIHRLLGVYLTEPPKLERQPEGLRYEGQAIDWSNLNRNLKLNEAVRPVSWLQPGSRAASVQLEAFLSRIHLYSELRNNPLCDGQSHLSPYLHFGQLAPRRVAFEILRHCPSSVAEEFLEELIVRRELADNFCYYHDDYDQISAFPAWAQKTLREHEQDERPYLYAKVDLEAGQTHDPVWNFAQNQLTEQGKMHGYLRMYWCKKLLEWTPSPEEALRLAIYFNDQYELDGRDPNGYAGIAWSIGGVHDRAFAERAVFGKVRYMSFYGLKRKFDVKALVAKEV